MNKITYVEVPSLEIIILPCPLIKKAVKYLGKLIAFLTSRRCHSLLSEFLVSKRGAKLIKKKAKRGAKLAYGEVILGKKGDTDNILRGKISCGKNL